MRKTKLLTGCLLSLAVGLAVGVFAVPSLFRYNPQLVCGNRCQNAVTTDRKFFTDELFLEGQTAPSQPFLLHLDLNRKKVGNEYQHYYYADLIYQNNHRQLYTAFLSDRAEVQPKDFLKSFGIAAADDLSSRETYSFVFSWKNFTLTASNLRFEGDFLVKNTLEYTKYVSSGNATVVIAGKPAAANSALIKIYSADYSKYVFFDGYDRLRSLAQLFVMWDEIGNFYLIDASDVQSVQPDYKSHTWILLKDAGTGSMRKAFSASIAPELENDKPRRWSMNVPTLNFSMDLAPLVATTDKGDDGLATGTVTLPEGQKRISGYYSFTRYGSER